MIRTIKSRIPERHKGRILAALQSDSDPEFNRYRGKRKAVVTLAGFYQNLGDMALTYAQKRFIEDTLPDHDVILLSSHDTYRRTKALKSICDPDDLITTIAGGNMGDVYASLEDCRRHVVRSFPENPVISFPQTIDFTDSEAGRKALARSARTYGRHKRLMMFSRESESARRMRESFPTTPIGETPDIVLSLRLDNPPTEREGVFVCIRDDKEAKLTREERSAIVETITSHHENVTFGDTTDVTLEDCTPERYEGALTAFWDMLRHQQVVVTDRLHCMIFCALTKTPCVVLANSNHKVEGVYREWLADLEYISFLEQVDADEVGRAVTSLKALDLDSTAVVDLSAQFEPLRKALRQSATGS